MLMLLERLNSSQASSTSSEVNLKLWNRSDSRSAVCSGFVDAVPSAPARLLHPGPGKCPSHCLGLQPHRQGVESETFPSIMRMPYGCP